MKKIFLLVAVAAAYVSHAQAQQTAEKIGYANMEYIVSQLPDVKQIETDLKSTQTQFKNKIDAKSKELQKQYADFNANMNTMADTVRSNRQHALEKGMADLEQLQKDAQTTLQNKQKLFMAPVYLKVNRAIQDVAKENGYAVILTQQISNYRILLYQNQQMDVSNLVLQKFGITPVAK